MFIELVFDLNSSETGYKTRTINMKEGSKTITKFNFHLVKMPTAILLLQKQSNTLMA